MGVSGWRCSEGIRERVSVGGEWWRRGVGG